MRRQSLLFDSHSAAACGCLLAIALCCGAITIGVADPPAIALKSPNPIVNGNFGGSVAALPDIDGDGKPEMLVAATRERVGSTNDAGRRANQDHRLAQSRAKLHHR